jgi:uncharacterized protein (TIGR03118 family)
MSNPRRKFFWASLAAAAFMFAAVAAHAQHYTRTDLTQDAAGVSPTAANTDPNLVNAWGLSRSSSSPWWVADNGTGLSTLYMGQEGTTISSVVVTIPLPPGSDASNAAPTGTVYNYTPNFEAAPGKPSIFLFVTEDGTISGWNPTVDASNAKLLVNRSKAAEYKGCAIASTLGGPLFYATNFKSGHVEVFDGSFHLVRLQPGAFHDAKLPPDYVPFNIQNVGGDLVVTFARREPGSEDEDHGAGLGYVDVFDLSGNLLRRFEHGTFLNAPWGIAESPADFGAFSHRLLVGNFGDGTISVFNLITGRYEGKLLDNKNARISIDGLWALGFGNSAAAGGSHSLFFTSGPSDESHGLFGRINANPSENRGSTE